MKNTLSVCDLIYFLFLCILGDILRITKLQGPVMYNFKDLKLATSSFSEESKIGEGGFGDVYKVTLIYNHGYLMRY